MIRVLRMRGGAEGEGGRGGGWDGMGWDGGGWLVAVGGRGLYGGWMRVDAVGGGGGVV